MLEPKHTLFLLVGKALAVQRLVPAYSDFAKLYGYCCVLASALGKDLAYLG